MKTTIEVKNRAEAKAIKRGLSDPATYALVLVIGSLLPLASDRARHRVLRFVADQASEEAAS